MKYRLPDTWVAEPEAILKAFTHRRWRLALVESCTGGLLTACLSAAPGASAVLDRAWVAYSNAGKLQELGLPADLLETYGAVSAEVAEDLARRARDQAETEIGLAITGIAGPGGGTEEKPTGLVFIALTDAKGVAHHRRYLFSGSRQDIRGRTVTAALAWLLEWAG